MIKDNSGIALRDENLRTQLSRGGLAGLVVRIASMAAGLVLSVTLARLLGPDNYGIYAFVFTAITLLGLPVKLGLPTLVLRETAKADRIEDGALMRAIWRWSDRIIIAMSFVVLGLAGAYFITVKGATNDRGMVLLLALPLVPLISLTETRCAAIRGLRRVALGTLPNKVVRPLLLAGVLAIASFWIVDQLCVAQVFAIYFGVAALTLGFSEYLRARVKPKFKGDVIGLYKSRDWFKTIIPLSMIAGLQVLSQSTDLFMLGILGDNADVGQYRVALSMTSLVLFGLSTVNLVLQPHFARAHAVENWRQIQKLTTFGARIAIAAALPVLTIVFLAGIELLSFIYGEAYAGAYLTLLILCLGQMVSIFFASVVNLLTMSGLENIVLKGLAISTAVNVALNLVLIPDYGIEGAAVASGVSIAVWNIALWVATWRKLGIDCSPLGLRTDVENVN